MPKTRQSSTWAVDVNGGQLNWLNRANNKPKTPDTRKIYEYNSEIKFNSFLFTTANKNLLRIHFFRLYIT